MAKPLRQYHEDFWYHVMVRGQRLEPLFFSPDDRLKYLNLLDKKLVEGKASLSSFALMSNHIHLLIQMGPIELGKIFHSVNLAYARWFNHKRGTKGHVVQGRPKVKIILNDAYLLTVVIYIHQNPLKAGVADSADKYKWSSDGMYRNGRLDWIKLKSWEFPPNFAGEFKNRKRLYLSLMSEKQNELPGGKEYIGEKKEFKRLERRKPGRAKGKGRERRGRLSKEKILDQICRKTPGITGRELRSPSRRREITKIRHMVMRKMAGEGYGPAEIGRFFHVTRGAVSQVCAKREN